MKNKNKKIKSVVGLSVVCTSLLVLSGFSYGLDKYSNKYAYLNYDDENKQYYINEVDDSNTSIEGEAIPEDEYLKLVMQEVEDVSDEIKHEEIRKLDEAKKQVELKRQQELAKQKEIERQKEVAKKKEEEKDTSDWMTFEATYYTPYCYKCSGKTAYGINTRESIYHKGNRVIAVDPRKIPLGSIVEVETPYETFTAIAGDTGGAIKGSKIDILVSTKKEAYNKGRHDVQLRIIEKAKKSNK